MNQDIINYFDKTLNTVRDKLKTDDLRHDFTIQIVSGDKDMGYDYINNKMMLSKDFVIYCYDKKESEPLLMYQFIFDMIIHYHRRQAIYNLIPGSGPAMAPHTNNNNN